MPIYEFRCEVCGRKFETIVLSRGPEIDVACPGCRSKRTERLVSRFATVGKSDGGVPLGDDFGSGDGFGEGLGDGGEFEGNGAMPSGDDFGESGELDAGEDRD